MGGNRRRGEVRGCGKDSGGLARRLRVNVGPPWLAGGEHHAKQSRTGGFL